MKDASVSESAHDFERSLTLIGSLLIGVAWTFLVVNLWAALAS